MDSRNWELQAKLFREGLGTATATITITLQGSGFGDYRPDYELPISANTLGFRGLGVYEGRCRSPLLHKDEPTLQGGELLRVHTIQIKGH